MRFSVTGSIVVFLAYGLHDALVVPEIRTQAWMIRFLGFAPVALLLLAFMFRNRDPRRHQIAMLVFGLAVNAVVLGIGALSPSSGYFIYSGYAPIFVLVGPFIARMSVRTQLVYTALTLLLFNVLNVLVAPYFTRFDEIAGQLGLEKIKTIGDAYMVCGGVPVARPDHAEAVCEMALRMRDCIGDLAASFDGKLEVRIGVHTGPVIAGVIGKKKFIYDVWGDTVNTASRMESHGIPLMIQVSNDTFELTKDLFEYETRGVIDVKGKGEMKTHLLLRRKEVDEGRVALPPS